MNTVPRLILDRMSGWDEIISSEYFLKYHHNGME
jgi:hypothetical protein